MSPLLNNIVFSFLSILYVFAVVAIMDLFVKKGFPQDISRKIVHICAASWLLVWVFLDDTHWSVFLNIAPAVIWFVLLIIKGLNASPDDDAVKTMTRTGDRRELLKGPLYFTMVMIIMGTLLYGQNTAAITMGILGFGDGLAPLFGKYWGKHRYTIMTEKSLEGSLAFLIFGFLGAVLFSFVVFGQVDFRFIIIAAILSTIVEAVSPRDIDNLLIPITCLLVFYII